VSGTDVIVIGSGPCGAVAARELVDRGFDVTMLDAGDRAPRGAIIRVADRTVARWIEPGRLLTARHRSVADPGAVWESSLSQGGLSNYWTSAVPRFSAEDFVDGSRRDVRFEWPISYDDLAPYYDIVERTLRVTAGPAFPNIPGNLVAHPARLPREWRKLCERAVELGYPMGAIPMAKGRPWMVAARATGFSSYHCVVKPLERSANFRLVRSARVSRIHWSSASGRADGVEYVDGSSGTTSFLEAGAIVVAAGALDSTQIMMRSISADFPHGLGNTHDVLGRYLHDHPRQWWPADFSRALPALRHPVYISRGPYDPARSLNGVSMTIGLANSQHRSRSLYGGSTSSFGVQVFGTIVPHEESTVSLDPAAAADDLDAPLHIAIRYDEESINDVDSARPRFREIFSALGIRAEPRGPFHELHPGSSVHWGGTVRMHRSPRYGMLDEWNRVHDVPNVVVCDASCFTTGPEKNPTVTAMAIAARAARHMTV